MKFLADISEITELMTTFHNEAGMVHKLIPEIFEKNWNALISSGKGFVISTEKSFIGVIKSIDLYDAEEIFIIALWFVSPENRGSGIGGKLYDKVLSMAKDQNIKRICSGYQLSYHPSSMSKIYSKLGFTEKEVYCVKEL